MPLKPKGRARTGVPKAGPKRRRSKAEEEAALRKAVLANTKAPKRGVRKSGKTRSYAYKEGTPSTPRPEIVLDDPRALREPREPDDFVQYLIDTDAYKGTTEEHEAAIFAFQVGCSHPGEEVVAYTARLGEPKQPVCGFCPRCGLTRSLAGSKTANNVAEWMSYRLAAYDADSWYALFDKDKSLWPFIIEEAEAEAEEGI